MKRLLSLLLSVIGVLALFGGCSPCTHSRSYSRTAKKATCGEDGFKEIKCKDCDEIIDIETIFATGNHTWKPAEAVTPTCTSEGWEEGYQCSVCGDRRATKIEKLPHTIKVIKGEEAGCETSGTTDAEYCTSCEQMVVEQTYTEPLGHTCDVYSNNCSRCNKQDVYLEISTKNDFSNYDKARNAIIYLDYCLDTNAVGYYLEIPAECTYVRVVGEASKTYKLIFIILDRTEPFRLDLVNANLSISGYKMFKSESEADIHIGFYGTSASLVAGKAADGAKGSLGEMDGKNGSNGECAISIKGDLTITVGADTCRVKGGDGGNGGNGCDGFAMDGFDGGNGGNGGAGIIASSITVIAEDGYSVSNLTIAGGKGGTGGAGGKGSLLYDNGKNGNYGSSAVATTVKVIYK